jgi:hypothetical protein
MPVSYFHTTPLCTALLLHMAPVRARPEPGYHCTTGLFVCVSHAHCAAFRHLQLRPLSRARPHSCPTPAKCSRKTSCSDMPRRSSCVQVRFPVPFCCCLHKCKHASTVDDCTCLLALVPVITSHLCPSQTPSNALTPSLLLSHCPSSFSPAPPTRTLLLHHCSCAPAGGGALSA